MVTEFLLISIVIVWMITGYWAIKIAEMETKDELTQEIKKWMKKN